MLLLRSQSLIHNLNRHFRYRKFNASSAPISSGLFAIDRLLTPADFSHLSNEAVIKIGKLRQQIVSSSSTLDNNNVKELLRRLDDISNELCKVLDVAEFCRNVHEDIEFKESAENVFHKLSHIINELNTDEDVYQKLKNISESDRNKLNGNNVCFIDNLIPNI